jgi:predicted Zn-dependent protease
MDAEARLALAERVLARSRADATEVLVHAGRTALARFNHETIHQHVDSDDTTIRVRALVGGRTGVASTNAGDDAALDAVVARAAELAGFAPQPAVPPAVAGPAAVTPAGGAFAGATAAADPEQRAGVAARIFTHARDNGCWSAGYVTTSTSGITIATSQGARLAFDGTAAGANVKMTAADSTGFAEWYSPDAATLDGDAVGARAAAKARAGAAPRAVEPGDWTVIMEPAAFGELIVFLASHFSAQSYDEGSSFLSGRLGERVMGTSVTIRDDYADPHNPAMPFDWQGTPKRRVTLVDRGIAREVVTDDAYARKLGRPNTGHGLPAPNAQGPLPLNLVVDPGTSPVDELIAGTARGILVTRLWYVRIVDQRKTILTGMTRDGTFLIENGTIAHGIRNLRFNQSLVDALGDCTLASEPVRTGGYSYSLVVPAVRFERFHFQSVTDY